MIEIETETEPERRVREYWASAYNNATNMTATSNATNNTSFIHHPYHRH